MSVRLGRVGVFLLAATSCLGGCATILPIHRPAAAPRVRSTSTVVMLHGSPLELHLAAPMTASPGRPLVLYATGDGGWFGAAVDMFKAIAADGYPAVGFSSRAFLKIERPARASLSSQQLAGDYATILAAARHAMGLRPETPVVLTGWSRGAAFAAIAGSEPSLRSQVDGVIAIGLSADEDLSIDGPADETDDDAVPATHAAGATSLSTYERLTELSSARCAVIQSTGDNYLRASAAHALFGPDTEARRFFSVPARNHRFSGGHALFLTALAEALSWVTRTPATVPEG